jgi:hypothetical protein
MKYGKYWFHLHFLLATYGIWGKYWFNVEKNEKKKFADLNFLGLFMNDLSNKKNPSVTRRCRRRRRSYKFVSHLQLPPYELESWNSGFRGHSGQLDVPHTQNFDTKDPKGSHLREVIWGYVV